MGEQDHAIHEIEDARARMSELAEELARHANPDHVKAVAKEKATEWKELAKEFATEKAVELKDQAREALHDKAQEMKTHAKEAVMQRTMEMKDRVDTPRGWSLLGAILGAGVGAVLMKKTFTVREERHIQSMGSSPRESGDLSSTGAELKSRTTDWLGRTIENQPLMLAVGSIALGVFASMLLPVSNRERQLIEPAKRKAQEGLSQLGDQLEQKLQGQEEAGGSDISQESRGDVGATGSTMAGSGTLERAEMLMGADRPGLEGSDRSESLATPTGSRIPPMPPLDDLSTKIH